MKLTYKQGIVLSMVLGMLMLSLTVFSQSTSKEEEIFETLRLKDSLLFKEAYNHCDTTILRTLLSDNLEFYHDQGGINKSKENFIVGISGLCHIDYKATRALEPESLEVFLMRDNGKIYGALQKGIHHFYGQKGDNPKYLTSSAKFTHLWLLENNEWKLSRVLSYDHK